MSSNDLSQLAIATLGVTFAGSWWAMRGDGSEKAKAPPTNASSKDEEAFIQYGSYLTSSSSQPLTNPKGNSLRVPNRKRKKRNIRLKQEGMLLEEGAAVKILVHGQTPGQMTRLESTCTYYESTHWSNPVPRLAEPAVRTAHYSRAEMGRE